MCDIEEFLKNIDIKKLGEKFSQKRNSFTDEINSKQHEVINQKQFFCAVTLDLCLLLFQDYMTSYKNNLDKLNHIEKERLDQFDETLSDVAKLQEKIDANRPNQKDDELSIEAHKLSLSNLYRVLSHADNMNEVNALAYKIRIDLLNLGMIAVVESFETLISQNDPALLKEIIRSVIKIVVGFEPTSLFSTSWDLYDLSQIKKARIGTATDVLDYLDNFSNSTFAWSVYTQMLIDFDYIGTNLQGSLDDKRRLYELLLENAITVVNNRLEEMYNNINKKAKKVAK